MHIAAHHPMKDFHPSLATLAGAVQEGFAAWRARLRQRELLAVMSERELRDIGLSHWDAQHEADKPFWRE